MAFLRNQPLEVWRSAAEGAHAEDIFDVVDQIGLTETPPHHTIAKEVEKVVMERLERGEIPETMVATLISALDRHKASDPAFVGNLLGALDDAHAMQDPVAAEALESRLIGIDPSAVEEVRQQ